MTKMTSRPIYVKTFKNHLLRNQEADDFKDLQHWVLKFNQMCLNDDTVLNLAIFMTWSNLFPDASALVKAYTAYSHVFPSLF